MNIDAAFKSDYLKAADLPKPVLVTINGIAIETLGQGKDAEDKPVLKFDELEQGLVLNKTNKDVIKDLYGSETDDWNGKQIVLFATQAQFGAKMVEAVRVRAPKGAQPAKVETDDVPY